MNLINQLQQSYSQPYNNYQRYNYTTPAVAPQQQQRQDLNDNRMPPITSFGWTDGINAAKAQNIQYGTSAILLDSKEPYMFIKTVGYDGIPRPLLICEYNQLSEEEFNKRHQPKTEPQPEQNNENYITKTDLDKALQGRFVTLDDLEDTIVEILQERMTGSNSKQVTKKLAKQSELEGEAV